MRTVGDHIAAVLAEVRPVPPLDVVLTDAAGCIVAEDLRVPADTPAMATCACDGYALSSAALAGATAQQPVVLPVVHDVVGIGSEPLRVAPGHAVKVSTGAPLPLGSDVVVPLEYSDRGEAQVRIGYQPAPASGVLQAGVHGRAGQIAISAGTRMGARQIAYAASLGRARVRVHPKPRVVIMAVGDELVRATVRRSQGELGAHAIYDANGPALRIAVQDAGAISIEVGPVGDDRASLREAIEDQLVRADLLITTGGLSDGPRDTVRDVLSPLGTVRFDRVAMSPGRMQGFGVLREGDERVPVFALPGHPVAAEIAFEAFVRPALRAMAGYSEIYRASLPAKAGLAWRSAPGVRQFVPANIAGSPSEGYTVVPVGDPHRVEDWSVGALSSANALVVVPEDQSHIALGDTLHCLILEG